MTETIQAPSSSGSITCPDIRYQVSMSQPESHLFEIELQVTGWKLDSLDLKMPVWTPGSYLVREYSRHLQGFQAYSQQPLVWHKQSKNHWCISTAGIQNITVRYQIFANELTVRTNHLDSTHAYFNPAALCFYIPGCEQLPIQIAIAPPQSDWQVTTPLHPVPGQPNTFQADNFDMLVDSPFEIGCHQSHHFQVLGKPHEFAIWGQGNFDPERMIEDTRRIITVEAELFGGLPYERYVFLLHLSSQGFGGLEHKTACTLNYSRFGFRNPDKYNRFLQLVAHEFFHLWNVKRIRPKALECFDYDRENYTPSLWFSEGTTSYYDVVIPLRAGIYDAHSFLRLMSKEITRFLTTPGRHIQPLSESSFDAWIKLYRRDANSDNSQMSYYLKGEMISLLLDLLIRNRHCNRRSLDDVMRQMWQQFGKDEVGFTPDQLQTVIATVADTDLSDFFHRYLETTEALPFAAYLEPFGLRLEAESSEASPPFLGILVKSETGRDIVKFVEAASPAQQAGIDTGDELLALDGIRITADQLSDRLKDYAAGDTIQVTLFHQDELKTYSVVLAPPRVTSYQIVAVNSPTPTQEKNFAGWLGCELSSL